MNRLALTLFFRMLRAGDFQLLIAALVIATASITAINLFVERIENTLYTEASNTIAADAKIRGSLEISTEWEQRAQALELQTGRYNSFNAMVFSETSMKLGRIKAVNDGYPLRGELEVSDDRQSRRQTTDGPAPGSVWLAGVLLNTLDINIGGRVKIGNAEFVVEAELLTEPDNASTMFGVAPRAMINFSDIEKTGAIQVGSRVEHALLVAGNRNRVDEFGAELKEELGEHYRLLTPEDGNRAVGGAIQRAQSFLLLAGSLSVILSGLAIAIAAQRFAGKQQSQVALLKCFGVRPNEVQKIYGILLFILSTFGALVGAAVGWLLHKLIIILLGDLMPSELAGADYTAFIVGIITCFVCLFSFAGPPILALKNVTPMQIWKQASSKYLALRANIVLGLIAVAGLIFFYTENTTITLILLAGIGACILLSTLLSALVLNTTKKIQARLSGVWRLGLANLQRQRALTGLQIFVFSSISLLLLVLIQVRTDLIETWKPQLENTPNHFVFNIFSNELDGIKQAFDEKGLQPSAFYPMSRGRLISINGEDIKNKIKSESRSNYRRELNLTWSDTLGADNKIVSGEWWHELKQQNDAQELLVSSEQEYAEGLGLELGDQLTFSVAGQTVQATLSSVRSVEWESMNPNFYMIFNNAIADGFSANWITSFYLAPESRSALTSISQAYPTISIIDLEQTLNQVKSVASRVSMAVEFILLLVLSASLLVILTSIKSSIDERLRETALLRSFGASRQFTQRVILIEFAVIGILAGFFACAGAELSLYFIQTKLFDMPYQVSTVMWIYAPIASTLIIAGAGYLATVATTHVPPSQALRNHAVQ